jgi:hypothetical protein
MCRHRAHSPWGHRWQLWCLAAAISFSGLEVAGLITEGSPATLSAYLRQLTGTDPACRHTHAGRAIILLLLAWLAAHLGWGLMGTDFRRRVR